MMVATKLRHRVLYLEKKVTNRKDRLEWRWGKRKLGGRGVGGEGGGEGGGKGRISFASTLETADLLSLRLALYSLPLSQSFPLFSLRFYKF